MARTRVRVVLPTSVLSVEHSPALKSIRVHQIARWSSIFGVHEVAFYKEPSTGEDEHRSFKRLIEDHWKYFFTPPYLRRALVPLTPSLKYVGLLPPIRLKAFTASKRPRAGERRLGYVYVNSSGEPNVLVENNEVYRGSEECRGRAGIVPVVVVSEESRLVRCADDPVYLGPKLSFSESLEEAVVKYRQASKYLIATDKTGARPEVSTIARMRGSDITLLFGGPKHDLFEISSQESFALSDYVDYTWNTVPGQEVVSVRTEEALIITLGILNLILRGP